MNSGLSYHREKTAVVLAVLVMCLLSLNFVKSHHLAAPFESRFLISSMLLGLVSIFLRFGLEKITPFHRSLYRIVLVMTFWSACFFFLPFPDMVLYLIPLPGFYFLFRIEIKTTKVMEDILAAGILLALGTFLYVQQRPLHAILFFNQSFEWINYYIHSPVIILMGFGFLRLTRHSEWKGLSFLGILLIVAGAVLIGSHVIRPLWPYFTEILCTIFFLHLVQLYFNTEHKGHGLFIRLTGISTSDFQHLGVILYLISVMVMHVCVAGLFFFYGPDIWSVVAAIVGIGVSLYLYRPITISIVLIEMALLSFINGTFFFRSAGLLWSIPVGLMILSVAISRHKHQLFYPVHNGVVTVLFVLYYALIAQFNLLNPWGILFILFPFACWIWLPGRPLAIPRKYHFSFWPVISFVILICSMGNPQEDFFNIWALSTILFPLGIFLIIRTQTVSSLAVHLNIHFLNDWVENSRQALFVLVYISAGISCISVILNGHQYLTGWMPVWLTALVLVAGAGIFMGYALTEKKIGFVIRTELMFWCLLALIRWKLDVQEILSFGSPVDGYLLIVISVIIAGVREIFRKRIPEFSLYFQKTILLYGVIGWLYLQFIQFVWASHVTGAFHHAELSSLLMAGLNLWLSQTRKNVHIIYTFVFINAAVLVYFFSLDYTNLMFYIFPAMSSVLILTQIFKDKLGVDTARRVRFIVSLILCGTSAFYNIMDFNGSVWFPVVATLVSTLLVLAGISLRIRVFLYLGTLFFIVNAVGVVSHIIINQPPENVTLFIGILFLVAGIFFTASFLVFQMKRQQIIQRYHQITGELKTWA